MSAGAIFDRGRTESQCFTALAVLLVLVRGAAFARAESLSFDSEQAIVGLMAKHLSELRTFPLFTYGQHYQLGVESWLIAPLFAMFGPSVAAMRVPLVVINAAVAGMLVWMAHTALGLRPAVGFLATMPFIFPTPVMAITLLENTGSAVEPLLYVLLLWLLRRRPFAFGALFAFGFLHREFTVFALPALALVSVAEPFRWHAGTLKRAAMAAGGILLVALVVDDAKMRANGTSLLMQAQMLSNDMCVEGPHTLMARVRYLFTPTLPVLGGGIELSLHDLGKRSPEVVGSSLVGWAVGAGLLFMLMRILWLARSSAARLKAAFGVYLAVIGACALAAYPLACGGAINTFPVLRYLTLATLLPTGLFATYAVLECSRYARAAMMGVFIFWGAANLWDNARVLYQANMAPEPDPRRELTEFLLSHKIHFARASFWDAYAVDFLSNEQVIVGSYVVSRIPEYERLVDEQGAAAANIERMPCQGQFYVAAWCIQVAAGRP